jgi:predicted RNA methylase
MSFIIKKPIITSYWELINDHWRNDFFHKPLSKLSKDKVVLDLGSGTGILSAYALTAGAKFVYAVDANPESAAMTQFILSRCFDQSRFKVINCNFWGDEIANYIEPNSVDILVSETVGPALFDGGMAQSWHCAKPFLKADAVSIPDCLSIDVAIWQSDNIDTIFDSDLLDVASGRQLDDETLIDADFAQALREYDAIQVESVKKLTAWKLHKKFKPPPTQYIKDVCKVTKDLLPGLTFNDESGVPLKPVDIDLRFDLDLSNTKNNFVALVAKLSFEDDTIYLQDALYMPWKRGPVLQLPESGKFQCRWVNRQGIGSLEPWSVVKL